MLTKGFDSIYLAYDWASYSLEEFAKELEAKGIGIERCKPNKNGYCAPDIEWSGFSSQGDGLAFSSRIRWENFIEHHPDMKEQIPQWYLLLVANPDYVYGGTSVNGRGTNITASLDIDSVYIVESGFFAGVPIAEVPVDITDLEEYVQAVCEEEANRMYKRLEEEHDWRIESEKERAIEHCLTENRELLQLCIGKLLLLGDSFTRPECLSVIDEVQEDIEETFDWDDLYALVLIESNYSSGNYNYQVTTEGKEFMK
jgi:hypothetical protein